MSLSSLRGALFLARMDTWYLLRRKETLLWTFVMPVVFFFFIGTITRGSSGPSQDDLAVLVPADAGFLADQVLARLEKLDYRIVRASVIVKLPQAKNNEPRDWCARNRIGFNAN